MRSVGLPRALILPRKRRGLATVLALFALACLSGCAFFNKVTDRKDSEGSAVQSPLAPSRIGTPSQGGAAQPSEEYTLTADQLDQMLLDYADRYVSYIVPAWEAIEKDNPSQRERHDAQFHKTTMVSSMYDMVTVDDAFQKLVNVTMVVTLQSRQYVDEEFGERTFGARAEPVTQALRKARLEIWEIAAQTMRTEQLDALDYLIWDWRQRNPDVQLLSTLRFNALSASRSRLIVQEVTAGTGFLAPITGVTTEVARTRALAERAFYMIKRMPLLLGWQAETTVEDVLLKPQVSNVTRTVGELPQVIAREREAIFRDLSAQEEKATRLLGQFRRAAFETRPLLQSGERIVVELRDTSASLTQTIQAVDSFMEKQKSKPRDPNAEPFDIEEYVKAAREFSGLAAQVNTLLVAANDLLGSPVWEKRLQEINQLAQTQAVTVKSVGESVIDRTFWRVLVLIVIFFVLLAAYRYYSLRLARRYPPVLR